MISNERPSSYGHRSPRRPKPSLQEDILKQGRLEVEGTSFVFLLKTKPKCYRGDPVYVHFFGSGLGNEVGQHSAIYAYKGV